MNRLLRNIFSALHTLTMLALVLAVISQYISPRSSWVPAFLGLALPIVIAVNVLFAGYWLFVRKRKWFALSTLVVILASAGLTNYFALRPFASNDMSRGLRIMTYNVQNFDLYNWSHNAESRDSIVALVKSQEPDVLCLQEFYCEDGEGFVSIEQLKRDLKMPYHAFGESYSLRGKDHWGLITLSRYPVSSEHFHHFERTKLNGLLWTDVEFDSITIRVFNVHLQSIQFSSDDFNFDDTEEGYATKSRSIARKLRLGFWFRSAQARLVASAIEESPHRVIVCGDFNDTPVSYAYKTISKGLQDAFSKKGFGIGRTFAGRIPGLRIDYMLLDKQLNVNGFKRIRRKISDHFPLVVSFE